KQLTAASGTVPRVTSAACPASPAAAASLAFTVQPSSVVAGVAIAPAAQIKVADAFGNGVPGASVSLALVGTGTLSGGAVVSDARGRKSGVSGESVDLGGSKHLTGSSGTLPSRTRAPF